MLFASCNFNKKCKVTIDANDSTSITTNTFTLLEFVEKTGSIIEKNEFPYIVKRYDLYSRLDEYLIIDIRSVDEYEKGHIKGAYNVQKDSLMFFFEDEVSSSAFAKIAIVDDYGPTALYVSTLLRFAGYNAYALKFGMGAWNEKFVGNIEQFISNKYANVVEIQDNPKPNPSNIPEFTSDNILQFVDSRVTKLIAEDISEFIISPEEVLNNPDDYFIVAYWSEDTYNAGHFPQSVRYSPRIDLLANEYLGTLPTDKRIVVYCNTGHHAAAIVAYLRFVGYDAASFMFGANSFMNVKLKNASPGAAIIDVNNLTNVFPIIEGSYRTSVTPPEVDVFAIDSASFSTDSLAMKRIELKGMYEVFGLEDLILNNFSDSLLTDTL